jgi:CheY-like chemotaxis protein
VVEGQARRIALLVEDEALVAMVAEDNLRAFGFEPICVETAAEALQALTDHPGLALAIIDVGLPDMRGDALAVHFRAAAPDLPILIASGYDEAEMTRRFSADSAIAVLGKPYSEYDMQAAIAALGLTTA